MGSWISFTPKSADTVASFINADVPLIVRADIGQYAFLSVYLPTCLFIFHCIYLLVCLCLCMYVSVVPIFCVSFQLSAFYLYIHFFIFFIGLSTCLYLYLSICIYYYLSLCLSVYLSIELAFYTSFNISICPSTYTPTSIYLSIYKMYLCNHMFTCMCPRGGRKREA